MMDYVTWVNQDVKRSVRYDYLIQYVESLEKKTRLAANDLDSLAEGIIPPERGWIGGLALFPDLSDSLKFTSPALEVDEIDYPSVDGPTYEELGIRGHELNRVWNAETRYAKETRKYNKAMGKYQARITEAHRRRFEVWQEDRLAKLTAEGEARRAEFNEMKIRHRRESAQNEFDRAAHDLAIARAALVEYEQSKIKPWWTLPREEWDRELYYRIYDNPCGCPEEYDLHLVSLKPDFRTDDAGATKWLLRVLNYYTLYGVQTTLGCDLSGSWRCTLSVDGNGGTTSITRIGRADYSPSGCIARTLLTFLDVAWDHFLDECG